MWTLHDARAASSSTCFPSRNNTPVVSRALCCCARSHIKRRGGHHWQQVAAAAASEEGGQSLEALFQAELAARQVEEDKAAEATAAAAFDGEALLTLLRLEFYCIANN
jgi:hypothetical protein